jgi:enoyl-CoA hydratase/carnithine racemase
MDYSTFLYEVADGIATVRLHNPNKLNALTFQTYEELERLFADLAHDNQVKVVIITGSGKGFCSGGSVHEIIGKLIDMSADDLHRFTRMTCNVTKHMRNLRKPIIAAVNGIAAGAGTMLALASDIDWYRSAQSLPFCLSKSDFRVPTWLVICCPG